MSTIATFDIGLRADTSQLSSGFANANREGQGFLKTIMATAGGFAVANAAMGLVSQGVGLVKGSIIGLNAELETSELQFTTLMGSAEKAKTHVAELFQFAKVTPYESKEVIQAARMMRTFGGDALDTMKNLTMVGDAAAAVSAPIGEVAFWVGRAYSAIQAGRPFGEAAARLQELAILSPQARNEMEKLQKSGASNDKVWAVFTKDMLRFNGAMAKQATTWAGLTSTLRDSISITAAQAFRPFFQMAKDGVSMLITLFSSPKLTEGAELMAKSLTAGYTAIKDGLKAVAGLVKSSPLPGFFKLVSGLVSDLMTDVGVFADDLAEMGFGGLAKQVMVVWNALKKFKYAITNTLGAIKDAGLNTREFYESLTLWPRALRPVVAWVGQLVFTLLDFPKHLDVLTHAVLPDLIKRLGDLADAFSPLTDILKNAFYVAVDKALGIWQSFTSSMGMMNVGVMWDWNDVLFTIGETVGTLIDKLTEFVTWLLGATDGAKKAREAFVGVGAAILGWLAIKQVIGIFNTIAGEIRGVMDAANKAIQPIKDLVSAMEKVVSKTVSLTVSGVEQAKTAIAEIQSLIASIKDKTATVQLKAMYLADDVNKVGTSFAQGIAQGAGIAFATIIGPVLISALGTAAAGIAAIVGAPALLIGGAIVAAIAAVLLFPEQAGYIAGAIVGLFINAVSTVVGALVTVASMIVGPFVNAIVQNFQTLIDQVTQLISAVLAGDWGKALNIALSMLFNIFVAFPLNVLNALVGGFGNILAAVGDFLGQFLIIIVNALGGVWNFIVSWIAKFAGGFAKGFSDWIGNAGRQGLAFIGALVTSLTNGLGSLLKAGADLGGQLLKGFIDALVSLPGKVAQAIRNAFANIDIRIGPFHITSHGISIDLPDIKLPGIGLATGAWKIPRIMPAILHPGEMVVPADIASRLRGETGGSPDLSSRVPTDVAAGSTLTNIGELVHIENFYGAEQDVDDLMDKMARRLRLAGVRSPMLGA